MCENRYLSHESPLRHCHTKLTKDKSGTAVTQRPGESWVVHGIFQDSAYNFIFFLFTKALHIHNQLISLHNVQPKLVITYCSVLVKSRCLVTLTMAIILKNILKTFLLVMVLWLWPMMDVAEPLNGKN